ncbi:MAG: cytochrome C biogenesis protein CcsA [Cocleimonas sp.]|nr:cytochrome C biogenesis protein CcsA [Cocleimonas sp.]
MTTASPHRSFYSFLQKIKNSRQVLLTLTLFSFLFVLSSNIYADSEPLKPLEAPKDLDILKVTLGERLFHDVRLSKDNTLACAGCHNLALGGADNKALSVGIKGGIGGVNSPTVYNSGLLFRQFWDGRAATLSDQVDGPVQADVEMGSLWPEVILKLYKDKTYPAEFRAIYKKDKEAISREHIKDAIAEFERSLVTINSPFDRYLKGDKKAIDTQAKEGYRLFKYYGCASCHQGANVGGNMYQVFGVVTSYFEKHGGIKHGDKGRFNVTGNPEDMHRFKVPSLRMAALTAPYLHNGKAETLRDAVDIMFEHQLGRKAPDNDKEAIVHFIKTLAGEHPSLNKEVK